MNPTVLRQAVFGGLMAAAVTQDIQAHGEAAPEVGTKVSAAISVTWRDEGMLLEDGRWQIPGVLMGGEAYPVEEDTTVDEARISVSHRTEQSVFGFLQVSSHDGVSDAEVHHAYAGIDLATGPLVNTLVAGRMAAAMTPANGEHTSDRLFSETPLALAAFLGNQLNDDGVRLAVRSGPIVLGIESWKGDAFPATENASDSGDVYLHYLNQWHDLKLHAGLWWLQADALNRNDTRYAVDGHSHGTTTTSAPEYWFDGRTEISGAFVRVSGAMGEHMCWGLEAQYLAVDIEGSIWDSTRLAQWQAEDNGGWLQASVRYQQHEVGVRWEQLVLDNRIVGAAALELAELTALYNPDHDPERTSIVYRWQARPDLALRVEAIDDGIQTDALQRVAVGIVWQNDLYR